MNQSKNMGRRRLLVHRALAHLVLFIAVCSCTWSAFADEHGNPSEAKRRIAVASAGELDIILALFFQPKQSPEVMDASARIFYNENRRDSYDVEFASNPQFVTDELCVTDWYAGSGLIDDNQFKPPMQKSVLVRFIALAASNDECQAPRPKPFQGFVPVPTHMDYQQATLVLKSVSNLLKAIHDEYGVDKSSFYLSGVQHSPGGASRSRYCADMRDADSELAYSICFDTNGSMLEVVSVSPSSKHGAVGD